MNITSQDVLTFKTLYKVHFGLEIDDETARAKLRSLVAQMSIIYSPISRQQLNDVNENVNAEWPRKISNE